MSNKQFEFRKAQIERYVKAEYEKKNSGRMLVFLYVNGINLWMIWPEK